MCEITVLNTGDVLLNRKLFLLAGNFGSLVHKDGWGFADGNGNSWKCAIPMNFTINSGEKLAEHLANSPDPVLGHIRRASPLVPVEEKNAHPFVLENITYVHNGKLTPKDEKAFVLEDEVEDLDKNGQKQLDKDGQVKKKKVNRSDSLIFFEEFLRIWKEKAVAGVSLETNFMTVFQATMDKFYGKFAMVFVIQGVFFIARGKTANLHISYIRENNDPDSKVTGWVVNTSADSLDNALVTMSNLQQLDGKGRIHFSYPILLKEETVFVAEKFGLREIGIVRENYAPVKTYTYQGASTYENKAGIAVKKTSVSQLEKLTEEIYDFMDEYSLHPLDIQHFFWESYGVPLNRATVDILKHFVEREIPLFANETNKEIKKSMRKVLLNLPLRLHRYEKDMNYPWMLNPKNMQNSLIKKIGQ